MTDVSEAGSRTDAAVGPMRLSPISQTSTQAARLFRRLIVKDRIGWRPSFARGTRALKLQRQSREKPHSQRQKKNDELLSPFFLVPEQKHSMFLRLITLLFFSGRGIAFTYAKSSWNNKRAFVPRGGSSSVKAAPTSSAAASSISPPFNDTFVSSSEVIVNDPSQVSHEGRLE